jgi:hypothetical protein
MALFRRMQSWFGKKEGSLDDELRFHLEKTIEANIARGMSADEAYRRSCLKPVSRQSRSRELSAVTFPCATALS